MSCGFWGSRVERLAGQQHRARAAEARRLPALARAASAGRAFPTGSNSSAHGRASARHPPTSCPRPHPAQPRPRITPHRLPPPLAGDPQRPARQRQRLQRRAAAGDAGGVSHDSHVSSSVRVCVCVWGGMLSGVSNKQIMELLLVTQVGFVVCVFVREAGAHLPRVRPASGVVGLGAVGGVVLSRRGGSTFVYRTGRCCPPSQHRGPPRAKGGCSCSTYTTLPLPSPRSTLTQSATSAPTPTALRSS